MKRKLAMVLATVMALTMAGCGGGSASSGDATGGQESTAKAQEASTESSDSGKDTLVIATDVDVDTLHMSDWHTYIEDRIISQIYDKLMFMDFDGAHEPEPRIAESYEMSDDGLAYTFHLRDDATFHDGSPITADDVKFSLETYMNSDYQGSKVEGLDNVEVVDEHTVVCHLAEPYAPFFLGVCQVNIGSKAYYEKSADDFANNPIGSGPYKFTGREKGSKVTLEAYEDYYRGAAAIKNVTYEVIPDQSTTAVALKTGEVDFAKVESSTLAQLAGDNKIQVEEIAKSSFVYVPMNLEQAPFDDVKVRQAVNYAINRENVVAVCYNDAAEVNSNICSKDRFGYAEDQMQYTYDPEKAKELLAEAGITTPYDLGTILVAERYSDLATVVQGDLAAVGLNVTIDVKEFNAYLDDLTSGNFMITALEMTLEGDTQELGMALMTDYIGTANNARYSDAEMDQLFADAKAESDTDARAEIFHEIFEKAQNEAIYAVLCNPLELYAHNASLDCQGIPYEGFYSIYNFSWK